MLLDQIIIEIILKIFRVNTIASDESDSFSSGTDDRVQCLDLANKFIQGDNYNT